MYIAYRYIIRMLFPVFSKWWEIWTKPPHVWPVASIVGKCCDWTWHLWLNHIPNRRFTFRGKQGIGCLPKKSLADELVEELGMKELKKLGLTGLTGLTQSQSQSHPNDRMHAGWSKDTQCWKLQNRLWNWRCDVSWNMLDFYGFLVLLVLTAV